MTIQAEGKKKNKDKNEKQMEPLPVKPEFSDWT